MNTRKKNQARRDWVNNARKNGAQIRKSHRLRALRDAERNSGPCPEPLTIFKAITTGQSAPGAEKSPYNAVLTGLLSGAVDQRFVDHLHALLLLTSRRMPKMLTPPRLSLLAVVAMVPHVSTVSSWKPRQRSRPGRLRSLLTHLLVAYPVPAFLCAELIDMTDGRAPLSAQGLALLRHRVALLAALGRGGSLKGAQRRGVIPQTLTRRMLHALSQHRTERSLVHAVRAIQLASLGAHEGLIAAIKDSFLGQSFLDDEPFWLTVLRWFSRQPLLPNQTVGPLLDYVRHQHTEADGDWQIRGRSARNLLDGMNRWHGLLRREKILRRVREVAFKASGYRAGFWEPRPGEVWSLTEILTSRELALEGYHLHHCVFSYGARIVSGQSAIWSLRVAGERVLTVEVDCRLGAVVQVRGRCNRRAKSAEATLIDMWASANELRVR